MIQQYTRKCHEFLEFLNVDVSSVLYWLGTYRWLWKMCPVGFRNSILSWEFCTRSHFTVFSHGTSGNPPLGWTKSGPPLGLIKKVDPPPWDTKREGFLFLGVGDLFITQKCFFKRIRFVTSSSSITRFGRPFVGRTLGDPQQTVRRFVGWNCEGDPTDSTDGPYSLGKKKWKPLL